MSRVLRIGLGLMLASLPLAGLQAQPARCDDGIRATSACNASKGSCCCCQDRAGCTCQAPTKTPAPSADHAAVPTPSHAVDEMVPVHAGLAAAFPTAVNVAAMDTHPVQVHPEKMLARLHVLQI